LYLANEIRYDSRPETHHAFRPVSHSSKPPGSSQQRGRMIRLGARAFQAHAVMVRDDDSAILVFPDITSPLMRATSQNTQERLKEIRFAILGDARASRLIEIFPGVLYKTGKKRAPSGHLPRRFGLSGISS